MTRYETLAIALAAVLAALVYISRQVRRLAAAVDFWARLPSEHQELVKATEANTAAIAVLVDQVAQLAAVERRRRRGP